MIQQHNAVVHAVSQIVDDHDVLKHCTKRLFKPMV